MTHRLGAIELIELGARRNRVPGSRSSSFFAHRTTEPRPRLGQGDGSNQEALEFLNDFVQGAFKLLADILGIPAEELAERPELLAKNVAGMVNANPTLGVLPVEIAVIAQAGGNRELRDASQAILDGLSKVLSAEDLIGAQGEATARIVDRAPAGVQDLVRTALGKAKLSGRTAIGVAGGQVVYP